MMFTACAGNGEDPATEEETTTAEYSNSNLPSKYKANTPGSLTSSNALIDASALLQESQGLKQIKDTTKMMELRTKDIELDFMVVDGLLTAIKEKLATAGGTSIFLASGVVSIEFSQEMKNKLTSIFSSFLSGTELDGFIGSLPAVGTSMPGPALCFEDNTVNGYDNAISLSGVDFTTGADLASSCTGPFEKVIKWNDAKSKSYVLNKFEDATFGFKSSSLFTYAAGTTEGTGLMTFRDGYKDSIVDMSNLISMKECGASNCVQIKMTMNMTMEFIPGTPDTSSFSINGKIDDNGGFIESKIGMTDPFNPTNKVTFKFRETFDSTGVVTAQQTWDGAAWQGAIDTANTYYSDTTGGAAGEVNLDIGLPNVTISGFATGAASTPVEKRYVLVASGTTCDANITPEQILGAGNYFDNGTTAEQVNDFQYFGDPTIAATAVVCESTFDTGTNQETFSVLGGLTVTVL